MQNWTFLLRDIHPPEFDKFPRPPPDQIQAEHITENSTSAACSEVDICPVGD